MSLLQYRQQRQLRQHAIKLKQPHNHWLRTNLPSIQTIRKFYSHKHATITMIFALRTAYTRRNQGHRQVNVTLARPQMVSYNRQLAPHATTRHPRSSSQPTRTFGPDTDGFVQRHIMSGDTIDHELRNQGHRRVNIMVNRTRVVLHTPKARAAQ